MTFKPLSMTGLLCLSLSLFVPQTSRSQFTGVIIPPAATDNYLANPALPGASINCDMLQYGLPASANKLLSVIAWDDPTGGNPNCTPSKFRVLDHGTGQTVTINVPEGGSPDVVLCSVPGNSSLYKVGLVVTRTCPAGGILLLTYDITGVGTSALTVTPASTSLITNTPNTSAHIDLFMDPINAPLPGWPTLHEFVIVWNAWNPNRVWAVKGDLLTPPTAMPVAVFMGNGAVPDVAAVTDGTRKIAHIPYTTPTGLNLISWDITGPKNTQVLGGATVPAGFGQPRIESFGYFPSGVSLTNFQAQVVTGFDYNGGAIPRIIDIVAYNKTSGVLNTVNCSVSPLNAGLAMWPTVTGGGGGMPSMSEYVANMGNQQYTLGWYHEANPSGDYYATYLTGTGTVPVNQNYWKVNTNATSNLQNNFNANTHNPFIAMSVSSNTGLGLLTAWWDGSDVKYKLSTSMAFKPSSVGAFSSGSAFKIYPNPTTDKLFVESKDVKQYAIADAIGRTVLKGDVNGSIDVSNLQAGAYMLSLINEKGERSSAKFVKE